MEKTTAKIEHRDYVPKDCIAVEFCNMDFYGFRADELKDAWNQKMIRRYEQYNYIYEKNREKIRDIKSLAEEIVSKVKEEKPFYRFWYTKSEKESLSKAKELLKTAKEMENKNIATKHMRTFSAIEKYNVVIEILKEHGLVLTSTSSIGNECITYTEIWSREE